MAFVAPPAEWDRAVTRPETDAAAAQARSLCAFTRGAMPAETLGGDRPVGADLPLEHIIVLMQENRSFDSYFGHLGKFLGRTDIESAPENTSVPANVADPASPRHSWTHAPMLCLSDTNHEWAGSHLEYNGGKMDGFYQANHGFFEKGEPVVAQSVLSGDRAMWWYDERDIPFYYQLAGAYAIADHYHASVIGPTFTNRDYLYAATSRGTTTNVQPNLTGFVDASSNILIFDELTRRGISWSIYTDGTSPGAGTFLGNSLVTRWLPEVHVEPITSYFIKASLGKLPQVVFIDSNHAAETVLGNDEHPPADIQIGQKFVSDVIHALFASPNWPTSALFLVYDEHGGLYDHVAPPPACPPDNLAPILADADDAQFPGKFDRFGFRVPFVAVSPYAKPGYVGHHVYDHTSITRFIEAKFKLPALTARDANADSLDDLFDFKNPPHLAPPALPAAAVDASALDACKQQYPINNLFTTDSGLPKPG